MPYRAPSVRYRHLLLSSIEQCHSKKFVEGPHIQRTEFNNQLVFLLGVSTVNVYPIHEVCSLLTRSSPKLSNFIHFLK